MCKVQGPVVLGHIEIPTASNYWQGSGCPDCGEHIQNCRCDDHCEYSGTKKQQIVPPTEYDYWDGDASYNE